METVIVRDFAYKPDDSRYHGNYPVLVEKKKEDPEEVEESSDSDDCEDDWEWSWSFQVTKKDLPTLEMADFDTSILSTIEKLLQSEDDLKQIQINRARTVFPFVKGTEYEMSLEASDELVIIQKKQTTPPDLTCTERWSSIDELEPKDTPRKNIELTLEPPLEEFSKQVFQFLDYNKNYGEGWLTALKVKVYGNWALGKGKVILKDLGLVPGNYVESK